MMVDVSIVHTGDELIHDTYTFEATGKRVFTRYVAFLEFAW